MNHTQTCLNTSYLSQSANCMAIVQLSTSYVPESSGDSSIISAIFAITQGVLCDLVIDFNNILCCSNFPICHSLKGEDITQLLSLLIFLIEV